MSDSLGEALSKAIAKVNEWIGQQEAMAKVMDDLMPGAGNGNRLMANMVRVKRDVALAALNSGDVIAMIAAYKEIKPALDLAEAN